MGRRRRLTLFVVVIACVIAVCGAWGLAFSGLVLNAGALHSLDAYTSSASFAANDAWHKEVFARTVDWHKEVGTNEIRTSWFLDGNPTVAMVCTADLSAGEVETSRETSRASQCTKSHKLTPFQVDALRTLIQSLPSSLEAPELKGLLLVSVSEEGRAKTYLYNRLDAPPEILHLYELTGACLDTAPLSQSGAASFDLANEDRSGGCIDRLYPACVVRVNAL